jgi:hypothetical protein
MRAESSGSMRKPKILLPPKRPPRPVRTELSAHPVAFRAVTRQGECLAEVSVPRNLVHEFLQSANQKGFMTLAWIGLHGLTRLSSKQAKDLARDLSALGQDDSRVPTALVETVQRASSSADQSLLISAGL